MKAFEPHAATGFQRITYWWKKHLAESRVLQAHKDQPSKGKEGREEGSTREEARPTHRPCRDGETPAASQTAFHASDKPQGSTRCSWARAHTHIYICRSAGRTRQQSRGNRCCSSCSGWGRGPGHCQQYARRQQIR